MKLKKLLIWVLCPDIRSSNLLGFVHTGRTLEKAANTRRDTNTDAKTELQTCLRVCYNAKMCTQVHVAKTRRSKRSVVVGVEPGRMGMWIVGEDGIARMSGSG
ncbi:unnamed protein product [Mesocestoides corti]|uniref:Apple domain-containing protein n=1 Tax=Mesocestoides corti TaxID=53468 RepID=A0A0R3U9A2_MESCO|nr:unnamed protein product [Mesocestoides corti]